MVGTVGLVFGGLIKRALPQQWGFLADTAAIQFTRNPQDVWYHSCTLDLREYNIQAHLIKGKPVEEYLITTHPLEA